MTSRKLIHVPAFQDAVVGHSHDHPRTPLKLVIGLPEDINLTRIKSHRRDIGAELRAGGVKPARRQFKQHRVGSRKRVGTGRPAISIQRRVDTITSRPKADRKFESYELHIVDDRSPGCGLRRLVSDPQSLVLAVDGACKRNGLPDPLASYGVHVSNRIPSLNEYDLLPVQLPQTNQCADLHAATQALEVVHKFIIAGEEFSHVIIKTNSEYLEKGLSANIWKWTGNGFRNWRGQPVVNGRMFKYLHEKVGLLEREYGMQVSFCLVPKEGNEEAARLARMA